VAVIDEVVTAVNGGMGEVPSGCRPRGIMHLLGWQHCEDARRGSRE
jgi:hypothetical protein